MNVSKVLLQTVESVLKGNPPTGVKSEEISILPEGKVPPSMGQRWLTIHPTMMLGTSTRKSVRKRRITFGITLSQRVRDLPNDRLGDITYLETLSMTEALEEIIPVIESTFMFDRFKARMDTIPIAPTNVRGGYDVREPPAGLPPKFQVSDTFVFLTMSLDPKHLYPSDFSTRSGNDKEQLYDKIAGFQITAVFESPEFQQTYPPLQCRAPYEL